MERGGGECVVRPYILKLDCGERKQPTQVSMNASSSKIVAFTGNAIMKVANLEQFSWLLTVPTGLSFRPERRNSAAAVAAAVPELADHCQFLCKPL